MSLVLLSLAIAVAAIVFSKSVLFERARRALDRRSPHLGYALKCTFCLMGWMALVATLMYRPELLSQLFAVIWFVDGAVSWFALWGVSTLLYRILWPFLKAHAPKMRIR